ncbi:MAG: tocopherol cyclase family protein [Bacteroidales bacterium]|nr:tocopherol cyclase family protein [Bacteroidales bacterium]
MFNKSDISRNECQLFGAQARLGYDWWWHSFTARDVESGEVKPFFFEFFVCNPENGQDEPVLGQLPENQKKGIRPSYLMVKAGSWGKDSGQLHRFFGWTGVKVDFSKKTGYSVSAGDCFVSETESYGSVVVKDSSSHPEWMCDDGSMQWNLKIRKMVAFNVGYGASSLLRKLQLFEMFWHAEGMKTEYEGTVFWNGRKYIVTPEESYGYADKNWGKGFTTPWVWLSSCNLTSEITGKKLQDSVFDIGGGRPKVGPIVLDRKLLSAFWYEGRPFEFNFSKFWTLCRTKFHAYETDSEIVWHVDQRTLTSRMVSDFTCRKEDMLLVNYESPDGKRRHTRLWNGGNGQGTVCLYHRGKLLDRIHAENIGCEYGEYDANSPYLISR